MFECALEMFMFIAKKPYDGISNRGMVTMSDISESSQPIPTNKVSNESLLLQLLILKKKTENF